MVLILSIIQYFDHIYDELYTIHSLLRKSVYAEHRGVLQNQYKVFVLSGTVCDSINQIHTFNI